MSNIKVREVESLLIKLPKQSSKSDSDPKETNDTIVDLSEVISSFISSEDIDLCISLLFDKGGLIEFCKFVATNIKFVEAKKSSLDLFKLLLERNSSNFSKYANDLEKLCRHMYNADTSSKVRCSALDVFCYLLSNLSYSLEFTDFNFKKFIEQLSLDIKGNKGSLIVYHQLHTLGILAKACPEKTSGQADLIFKVLKDQLIKKTGSQVDCTAAAGAIRGITSYLHKFPQGLSDTHDFYAQIYSPIHRILNPNLNLPKRDIQRAALDLIHEQGAKFAEDLLKHHEVLYRWFVKWCDSSNRDDRKAGLRAMDTFIVVLANNLELFAEEDPKRCKQVFGFLLREFNVLLNNSQSPSQISLSVKGYGLLAGLCRILLSPEDVFKMFSRVLAVSQQSYFQSSQMIETKVANLPSYIESLGFIVSKMDYLSNGMVDSLHQLCMALVENFEHVSQFKVFLAYRAVFTLLCALREKTNIYKSFLRGFVYHFILHTCSHLPVVEKEFSGELATTDDSSEKWNSTSGLRGEPLSYRDYLPLWKTLLSPEAAARIKVSGKPTFALTTLSYHLYEQFLECSLEMIEKLDLNTFKSLQGEHSENEEASSDPVKSLQARTPKDFQIYVNLCCLMEEVVPLQSDISLEVHLPRLFLFFVKKSSLEPLVSTHYSVLTLFLLSARRIHYLDRPSTIPLSSEVESIRHLLTGYISEVLQKCKQHRDHLLSSCLSLVLQMPICIVEKILAELVSPLQMALQMGLSYLPIAHICVGVLHTWSNSLQKEQIRQLFPEVLPMLLPYLRSEESLSEAELQTRLITAKMSLARQRRKVDKRKQKENKRIENSEMRKIQLSILHLLGHLDQDLCFSMVTNQKDAFSTRAIAWDAQKHLLFSVPFHGWKLDIHLDEILPHITEKALNSSNRQTKVAASELLHSLIILMIGIGHQQNEQTQQKRPMTALYSRVFRAMLVLSCDADQVPRQLFLPLTYQVIHWFTNNRTFEHPYTSSLLQTIMDGIVTPNDPALRDFSAQCLVELLKWSRKQNKCQVNLKSVLKRILALCQHPSAYKRLGGCLAWNSIYTEVREDESSCSEWTVFLLANLIACLAASQRDDAAFGTQSQCQTAIDRVDRILRIRSDLFNKPKPRRLPNDLKRGTLAELLEWLLAKIGSESVLVRHASMKLIVSLGPHTKGFASGQDFIEKYVAAREPNFLLGLVEKSLSDFATEEGEKNFGEKAHKDVSCRIKALLAALDAYVWVISKDIIKVDKILSPSRSKIFKEIDYFVSYFASRTSEEDLFSTRDDPESVPSPLTLSQAEQLDELRCTAIVRILDFIKEVATRGAHFLKGENSLLNEGLRHILLKCLFHPGRLGFNLKDTMISNHLPQHLCDFLVLMKKRLHPELAVILQREIDQYVAEGAPRFLEQLPATLDSKAFVSNDLHFFLDGLSIAHRSEWLRSPRVVSPLVDEALPWVERALFAVNDGGGFVSKEFSSKHLPLLKKYLKTAIVIKPLVREELLSLITCEATSRDFDGRELTKGAHVLAVLGEVPLTLVIEDPLLCVDKAVAMATRGERPKGVELLSQLMKLMVRNADIRTKYSAKVIDGFLGKWEAFCALRDAQEVVKEALLSLVMTVFMADKDDVIKNHLKSGDPHATGVLNFFRQFLCDPQLDLPAKARALKLLPFFLTERDERSVVEETLQSFRLHNLPLKLSEYQPGSTRERELRSVILELLLALELTVSLHLLGFIVRLFCCEETHQYDEELLKTLERLMKSSLTTKQIEILEYLWNFFCDNTNQSLRVGALEKVLIPSLHHANAAAASVFFVARIGHLVPLLNSPVAGKDDEQHKTLVNKYGAYTLIQILYSKLPREKVFAPGSEVNCAYDPKDASGKELTKEVMKRSVRTAKGELRHNRTHQELRRKCSCAAYNTLISVLSNVQDQLKFYTNFLFSEVRDKDEAIFEALVDTDKKFEFDIEVNFDPSSKNRFVTVHLKQDGATLPPGETAQSTVQYMTSHYLSDSSLKEDLSQFDFSSSVVLSQSFSSDEVRTRNASSQSSGKMALVRLDRGDFNNHEVMPNLTAIIRHMVTSNIIKLHSGESVPSLSDLPQWMTFVRSKLLDKTTNANVRLFLLRFIMNTEDVFAPYANLFVDPMLSVLVDGVIGSNINYFISDLMVTLLSWGERGTPKDQNLCSETFQFLVRCTPHLRADVFKYNLNLIKSLVETWKSILTAPGKVVTSLLEVKNGAKREVEGGLQIAGILLANGLTPFDKDGLANEKRFCSLVSSLMTEKGSAKVYSAAAEVLGLYLKLRDANGADDEFVEGVTNSLQSLLGHRQYQTEQQALSCVFFIQKHFPKIVGKVINKLLGVLPHLYGIYKERVLQCLVSHAPHMEDVFLNLKMHNILENLTTKEAKMQLVSLELVNAVLVRLSPKEIEYLLPGICSFETDGAPSCRELMYESLIWIYDNYDDKEGGTERELARQAQTILLKGTQDEDAALRLSVRNFWIQRAKELTLTRRLSFTLKKLYTPETEDSFLLVATHVLLEATHDTADFLRPIFQHPLTECLFREMKISAGWRAQHASMIPLFVDSQEADAASSMDSLVSLTQGADADPGRTIPGQRGVHATQNYLFSATQNPGGAASGGTYNWVTGASLDPSLADKEFMASHAPSSGSASGLYFSENTDMKRFKRTNLGSSLLHPDEPDSKKKGGARASVEAKLLRRRFVVNRDRETQTSHFARQEEVRRKLRDQIQKERKLKREAQVTMYRDYRVGELPDIQIPHKALIAPLQALAEKDESVASGLFQLLAEAVIRDSSTLLSSDEQEEWKKDLYETITNILSVSETCNPHIMRPILHLLLIGDVEVNPEHVSTVCLRSNLEYLGILCLERQHMRHQLRSVSEPVKKRQRKEPLQQSSKDTTLWLNIAELYKNMSMWDAFLGVLKSEIGDLKNVTIKALEAESERKHFEAYKNYITALNEQNWDEPPSEQEQHLWREWFVSAAETLGQWDEVERFVEKSLLPSDPKSASGRHALSLVWDLPRQSLSLALPALVLSKLMRILHGADDDGGLCEFIDASRKDPRQRLLLESEMSLPLAVLCVNQEKNEEARSLLRSAQVTLLSRLVQCSTLSEKSMLSHLKSVQALSELQDFVALIMHPARNADEVKGIVSNWGSLQTSSGDYATTAQYLAWYRNLYLHFLKRTFNLEDSFVNQTRAASHMGVIKSALANTNPHLAHRHLTKLERIHTDAQTECQMNFFKTQMSIMRGTWKKPEERLPYLVEAWSKYLSKVDSFIKSQTSKHDQIEGHYLLLEGSLCFKVCEAIREMKQSWRADAKEMKTLASKFPTVDAHRKESWYKELLPCSQNGFLKAVQLMSSKSETLAALQDPHTTIFGFYEDCLEGWRDYVDVHQLRRCFLKAVLQGMAAGSTVAHFRFPRLIHLMEDDPSLIEVFRTHSKKVPVWMSLLWLSHLFIYFDKAPGPALHPLFKELTQKYPQAVVYPFEVSRPSFDFSTEVGSRSKKTFEEMKAALDRLSLVHQFIAAVSLVHVPHIEMKDYVSEVSRLRDPGSIRDILKECYKTFIAPPRQAMHEKGSIYLKPDAIMRKAKSLYEARYGTNLNKMNSASVKELKNFANELLSNLREISKAKDLPSTLQSYSPWLATFNSARHSQELEIPGQYHGRSEPLPEYHTKVSSFDPALLLLKSLRLPIRLTIVGSDEKDHHVLVKSGEDLRTDQRVEGVLSLLNNIYESHSSSHLSQKPSLVTYVVTPLSTTVGILEWVNDTLRLEDMLFSSLSESEAKQVERVAAAYANHSSWEFSPKMMKRDECVNKFKDVVNGIPWDLLRRGLLQLASGHEGFFHLRNTFLSSFATLCVSHWLLGIGDRHVTNVLFGLKTGRVIGIDFGHHFESATQFLPFPELMPFRLTPQIVNVAQPLGLHGQLRETMIACLAALRDQRQVIMSTVEAFVKEPTKDWLSFVSRLQEDSEGVDKFSARKMEDFSKKLRGSNPARILASIVERNSRVTAARRSSEFKDVVLGKGVSRKRDTDGHLSVAEQVDILIELATDPNILGRTWAGWKPFF